MSKDYIAPSEATRIRILDGIDGFEIDATDNERNYTEATWTIYGGKPMPIAKAIEVAGEFASEIGRPDLARKVYIEAQLSSLLADGVAFPSPSGATT